MTRIASPKAFFETSKGIMRKTTKQYAKLSRSLRDPIEVCELAETPFRKTALEILAWIVFAALPCLARYNCLLQQNQDYIQESNNETYPVPTRSEF